MENNNQLEIVVKESGLEPTQAQTILTSFQNFFKEASEYEKRANEIQVTDISQIAEMTEARTIRLALKGIRTNAEKVRIALKEDSLRQGKAIDGIANVIKALTVPLEQHLEKQEKFAEIWAEAKKQEKLNERLTTLSPLVEDVSMYNLADMSQEAFDKLVENAKQQKETEAQARVKAEEERLAKIEADRIENERIRIENEKLRAEQKEKDEADKKAEAVRLEEARIAKAKADAEEKAHQEALRVEREKVEKLEREAKAKADAEEKARLEAEEKSRQEKLAPEKDKLFKYSEQIKAIQCPDGLSKAGLEIVKGVEAKLLAISQEIKDSLKNL